MSLAVTGICFDHARGSLEAVTVPLRYDETNPVVLPEWRRGQGLPSVAAYRIDRLLAKATVLVQFAGPPGSSHQVRAVSNQDVGGLPSPAPMIAGLDPRSIAIGPAGLSGWEAFSFDTSMVAGGVNVSTFSLMWQVRRSGPEDWANFDLSLHKLYSLIAGPTAPWTSSASPFWAGSLPRTDLLDFACLWANGARTSAEVAEKVTRALHDLGGRTFTYDALVGAPHYTVLGAPLFLCDEFLDRLRGGRGTGRLVNCSDCATIVSTMANLVGADLWQSKMGLVGSGFLLNPIVAIGRTDWTTLAGGFSFHEVAWTGACREEDLIYDACVLVDGDADPTAEPRKPVLALGTIFGEPGAGGFRDQIASPPGRVACEPQPSLRVRRSVDVGAPWPADELPVKIERSVVGRTRISPLPPERMRFEGFDVFGRELPNWRLSRRAKLGGARDGLAGGLLAKLSRVGGVESADLALQSARPQVVVSIWRAPDDPGKIIRIESIECVDSRNAHQRMLRAAADIENPGLEVWDRGVVDESALRLPDGSLAMFTRGNHAHVLRTIGPKAVDVTGEANMLDDWLMRSGEPDEAAAPAPANVPVWLRTHVGAPPALARYRVTPGSERH